jgi:adenylate cyclase
VLAWGGRGEDSLRFINQAMRLNPHYPFFYLWTLGHAFYMTRRTEDAVDAFRKLVQLNPNFLPAHAYLAALFIEMGRDEEAQAAWRQAQQLSPGASLASLRQRLPYRRPADLDRFLAAARRAGLE